MTRRKKSLLDRLRKEGMSLRRLLDQLTGGPSRAPIPVPVKEPGTRGRSERA